MALIICISVFTVFSFILICNELDYGNKKTGTREAGQTRR
jgi:hypothetical protein